MTVLFQSLSQIQKVNFFCKCQELLIQYHPKSSFIARENNLNKCLNSFLDTINQYKGFCYISENTCILWNQIFIKNPNEVNQSIKDNAYKEPHPNFNGFSIDFLVVRDLRDVVPCLKENFVVEMKYILFIREGNPKMYKSEDFFKLINDGKT